MTIINMGRRNLSPRAMHTMCGDRAYDKIFGKKKLKSSASRSLADKVVSITRPATKNNINLPSTSTKVGVI